MTRQHWVVVLLAFLALSVSAYPAFAADETWQRPVESPLRDIFTRLFGSEQFGKSYALVIGIGDYDAAPKLNAPKNDARRVRDFLVKEAGFDYVVTLTDGDANRDRISRLMDETFPDLLKSNDRFLFYFSGHGATRTVGSGAKRGYLLLKKSRLEYWDEMLDMHQIGEWAENLGGARHVLFVLDACFSGLAAYQVKSVNARSTTLERLARSSSYLVTAGVDQEESYSFNGSSLFTDAFLASARGQLDPPTDGIVSLDGLIDRINRYLDEARSGPDGKNIRMTPQLYRERIENNEGEFFFLLPDHFQRSTEPNLIAQNVQSKSGAAAPTPSPTEKTAFQLAEQESHAVARIHQLVSEAQAAAANGQCDVAAGKVGAAEEVARQVADSPGPKPVGQEQAIKNNMQALQEASRRCLAQVSRPRAPTPSSVAGPICVLPDGNGKVVESKEQCRQLHGVMFQ